MKKVFFKVGDVKIQFDLSTLNMDELQEGQEIELPSDGIIAKNKIDFDSEVKQKINTGIEAMSEIKVKDFKKAFGLEFEGKTFEALTEALQSKIDAIAADGKKGTDERISVLQQQLDNVIKEKQSFENDLKNERDNFGKFKFDTVKNNEVLKTLRSLDNLAIPEEQLSLLINNGVNFVEYEGKIVRAKSDGSPEVNPSTNRPFTISDHVNDYIEKNKWVVSGQQGGRGGKDDGVGGNGSGKKISPDEFIKEKMSGGMSFDQARDAMRDSHLKGEISFDI